MRWLIIKDLQILKRSPLLIALLVIYPVAISLLIGVALSRGPEKPKVAVFSGVLKKKSTITFGSDQVDTAAYRKQFFKAVDAFDVGSREQAIKAVENGDALAAMVIPADITQKLASGIQQPTIEVAYNAQDPVKAQFVEDTIKSKLADANAALSEKFTEVAFEYIRLIVSGGEIDIFGTDVNVLGLERAQRIIEATAAKLPKGSSERIGLNQVSRFSKLAIDNLDLSDNVLASVGQPIKVKQIAVAGRRTPLNTFAVAIAAAISLMFISVLLAAGMLALEREEYAYSRLVRGLVSRGRLLVAKILLATFCAVPVTLILLVGIALFVELDFTRFAYWLLALGVAGIAFASLGVAIGGLAREARAASLMAFLLTLPLVFLALVPSGAVSGGLYDVIQVTSALFPFKPALDGLNTALNGGGTTFWLTLLHLAAIALGFGVVARLALRRFA